MARRLRHRTTRPATKSWASTRWAIYRSGSRGVSTQWLMSSSDPAVPPRLGSQLAAALRALKEVELPRASRRPRRGRARAWALGSASHGSGYQLGSRAQPGARLTTTRGRRYRKLIWMRSRLRHRMRGPTPVMIAMARSPTPRRPTISRRARRLPVETATRYPGNTRPRVPGRGRARVRRRRAIPCRSRWRLSASVRSPRRRPRRRR